MTKAANLGDRLAAQRAGNFVGRAAELERVEAFLQADASARVLLVHGLGGIGKTTLVRRAAERATELGFALTWLDGREIPPVPDALEDALADARRRPRSLIVIDSYELVGAAGGHLRRDLLPTLADEARVIIAGRETPDADWRRQGWGSLVSTIALGPLEREDAAELLTLCGVADPRDAAAIAAWAEGSPMALTLAAAATDDPDWDRGDLDREELVAALLERLTSPHAATGHLPTLGTACIARQATEQLLGDVLDEDANAASEFDWLLRQDFTEPLSDGVAPHALVRRAVRAHLKRTEPLLERHLRRRIADHLYGRASGSANPMWTIDLAHLAESPALRWGFSWDAAARYRVDDARGEDAERIESALGRPAPTVARFIAQAPEHVIVCRDAADAVCGFAIAMTPASAPAFADDDVVLGPRLRHARALAEPGEAIVSHSNVDLVGDPSLGVTGLLGMASVLRSGRGNPRFAYLPIDPAIPAGPQFAAVAGAVHLPELDVKHADRAIECHLIDYGPGGLLAALRDFVYRELGLDPPPRPLRHGLDELRAALRVLGDDRALAASPLAPGGGRSEAAGALRERIVAAANRAFGDRPRERELRAVLERGYLDPAASHELAAGELHLSRASYFRRLQEATLRLAEEMGLEG